MDEASLRAALTLKPDGPFYEPQIAADREAIQAVYLNRGFDRVQVDVTTVNTPDGARADLTYTIREGSQLFVDRILIVGNRRTATATIEKALTIKAGEPLGLSALFESQRRLSALGLVPARAHHRCRRAGRERARRDCHRRRSAGDDDRLRRGSGSGPPRGHGR